MRTLDWIVARNTAAGRGIHDDDEARRQGFPGALVPGNVHVVLAGAVLTERFGSAWHERGVLSHRWRKPVYDGERVRVELDERPPGPGDESSVDFRLVKQDGTVCTSGYAGVARPGARPVPPWEREEAAAPPEVGDYDPLPTDPIGHSYGSRTTVPDARWNEHVLAGFDPNPWYVDASPWGGPVVPAFGVLGNTNWIANRQTPSVVFGEMRNGMNAALDLVMLRPVHLGEPIEHRASLVAKGTRGDLAVRTVHIDVLDRAGDTVAVARWTIKWRTARPLAR
ncbi:MAG TPA: hypothetical protein VE990_20175 [Acidimicrobiales bacterium]|nr:hypothetical protein [Acidimicrobiales bacterium]